MSPLLGVLLSQARLATGIRGYSTSLGSKLATPVLHESSTKPPSQASLRGEHHHGYSSSTPAGPHVSSAAANPPSTTRPPPLDLPTRKPETSTFSHLLATGKAYLTFYKTGLKHIYTNTRLVYALNSGPDAAAPTHATPTAGGRTRAQLLLLRRWRHDVRRLPLFALLLLVCGEFTPLAVLALPQLVPYTCRIPAQERRMWRAAEERRARSFADLCNARASGQYVEGGRRPPNRVEAGHIARRLGLVSPLWDRVGMGGWAPAFMTRRRVAAHIGYLADDDALLLRAGGVPALESEEVRLACVDRGIDVLGRSDEELRRLLGQWLHLTAEDGKGAAERRSRMEKLLLRKENDWAEI
jgi:hypothetical protein